MSERIPIFEVDFQQGDRKDIPAMRQFKLRALRAGVIHAVVSSWEVWSDAERKHKITTHPEPWLCVRGCLSYSYIVYKCQ